MSAQGPSVLENGKSAKVEQVCQRDQGVPNQWGFFKLNNLTNFFPVPDGSQCAV
jgi:hypothetical protein